MKSIAEQYELAKKKATLFMQKGQLNAYLKALTEMNDYKRLLTAVTAN